MDGKNRHGNGGVVLAGNVPAGIVSRMRKKRVNAGDGLRVSGDEFRFAAFLEDGVHAVDGDRFKRIVRSGLSHSVMHGDEVADIGDDENGD
jgi:hypothetical protein